MTKHVLLISSENETLSHYVCRFVFRFVKQFFFVGCRLWLCTFLSESLCLHDSFNARLQPRQWSLSAISIEMYSRFRQIFVISIHFLLLTTQTTQQENWMGTNGKKAVNWNGEDECHGNGGLATEHEIFLNWHCEVLSLIPSKAPREQQKLLTKCKLYGCLGY